MQTTARERLCSKPGEGGRIDRTCKYGVEIQIHRDEWGGDEKIGCYKISGTCIGFVKYSDYMILVI